MADRVCLYVRPMLDRSEADQLAVLRAWAAGAGHQVVREVVEPARKRGPDHRREASRMLADATRRHFDRVAAVSLLALCRSVQHADAIFAQLDSLGIALTVLAEGIDTATDDGRAVAAFAMAAQLEHALHAERATIGARRRIEAGFKHGRSRVPATTEARIVSLIRAGTSSERICRIVGCGKSTVYRVREELKLL